MSGINIEKAPARGDVDAVLAELGEHYVSQPYDLPDGTQIIFHSSKMGVERLPALNPKLADFVTASETVIEPASFKDYVKNYKTESAVCFASLGQNRIIAVLDYHGRAREGERLGAEPKRASHKVVLLCPFDLDYAKWRKIFGEPLDQNALGNVLEDLVHTIADPAVADLQEAIAELRIDRVVRFQSRVNRTNGTIGFTYDEVEEGGGGSGGGGEVRLPDTVKLVLPVFQGGELVEIELKLRYRMEKGKLAFILAAPGIDKIERDQFRRIGEDVRSSTSTPVFYTT